LLRKLNALRVAGYGENAGSPSPAAILEASVAAVGALQKHLGLSRAEMAEQLPVGVLGHSLGSAAALQFVRHAAYSGGSEPPLNIDRIVLVSPFTSLLEMSKRVVGPIPGLRHLLRHPFDNRAELQAIIRARKAAGSADGSAGAAGESKGEAKQSSSGSSGRAPKFTIIHGSRDEIVPVEQGRELGKLSSAALPIEYVEIRGGDHNGILYSSRDIVFKAMM
jgi:pimeloyl-ACP methyl ester carboxylesterase